jgi:hypothetical protein
MFWANFYAAVGFWSIALAGGLYWGRRYVRAIENRAGSDARIAALEARLAILEAGRPDDALPAGAAATLRLEAQHVERSSGTS